MKLIIKPETEIDYYYKIGIRDFLLPLKNYSVEYTSFYTLEDIENIKKKYKDINIFVSINKNIFNNELENLESILKTLDTLKIKAVFFYDQSIIMLCQKIDANFSLVWAQTHMVTNYKTADYYYDNGVSYALLSKEITKDEITDISKKSKIGTIVELISLPSVAFSRRKLITNYYRDLDKDKRKRLEIEEKVSHDSYELDENSDGVTFYKKSILNGCFILDDLIKSDVDYILLKEDMIIEKIFHEVVKDVFEYVNNYKNLTLEDKNNFIEKEENLLGNDTGFFYKKTIYKVK